MKKMIRILMVAAFVGLGWGMLRAADMPQNPDVITLKDGRILKGQIVAETDDNVSLSVDGVSRSYSRDFIASISYGENTEPAPSDGQGGESTVPAPRPERLISQIAARYGVTERDVLWVRDKGIVDDDLSRVFWVAATAEVRTGAVVRLRLEGWSWSHIEHYFGIHRHYEVIYAAPPPPVAVAVVAPVIVPRPWLLFRILFWPFLIFRHIR